MNGENGVSMIMNFLVVFFVKQKTAYEMSISDWSSDVCSSDLRDDHEQRIARREVGQIAGRDERRRQAGAGEEKRVAMLGIDRRDDRIFARPSSEERRVGKECVSTCCSRSSPSP